MNKTVRWCNNGEYVTHTDTKSANQVTKKKHRNKRKEKAKKTIIFYVNALILVDFQFCLRQQQKKT